MSEVNYINPTAILPQQEWKPKGFMGGMQYAQQLGDYEDVMSLSKLMSQMGAQEKIEDLTLGAPVRAAKRGSEIATANATSATIGRQKLAELGVAEDTAKVSRAGVDNKIAQEAAAHYTKMGEEGMKQISNQIRAAQTIGGIMQQNGPAGAAIVKQMLPNLGIDPSFAEAVMRDPAKITQFLNSISGEVQAKLAEQESKNKADMERQQYASDSAARSAETVARINADSRIEQARMRASLAQSSQKLEQAITQYGLRIARGEQLSPAEMADYNDKRQMFYDLRTAMGQQTQAGAAELGLPRVPAIQPPPVPGQRPALKVGATVNIDGKTVQITDVQADGTYKVKDAQGRTGTWDGK